ncbi:MAG: YggT family protein [Chloroflexi bacterium]|nr:YggT family protein [Chloroflexota bacterium]
MIIFLLRFIQFFFTALNLAIIARVILSWFRFDPTHPISTTLYDITEPILGPLRRYIPPIGMIDISPMVAIILLNILQTVIEQLIIASLG